MASVLPLASQEHLPMYLITSAMVSQNGGCLIVSLLCRECAVDFFYCKFHSSFKGTIHQIFTVSLLRTYIQKESLLSTVKFCLYPCLEYDFGISWLCEIVHAQMS